jgi:O-antigen biosynthesis protein
MNKNAERSLQLDIGSPGDHLAALKQAGFHRPGEPLRLHLGCGEQRLAGYVNIDYPPPQHTVQTSSAADVFADITELRFPAASVDEIRSHHLFEHFDRPTALAMLARWHRWLKPRGRLHIETPDVIGSAQALLSDRSYKIKQAVLRHLFGSHEAAWAYHYDGWYDAKFRDVLSRFGFEVDTRAWSWPHEPFLANVEAIATKARDLDAAALTAAAEKILEDSLVADVPGERAMHRVWCAKFRSLLEGGGGSGAPSAPVLLAVVFSKDRPFQLDGTLRSFFARCQDADRAQVRVLYAASDEKYRARYDSLKRAWPKVHFVPEREFRDDLLSALRGTELVLFLVDDNIFVRDFRLGDGVELLARNPDLLGFSLRLGGNTSHFYMLNRSQRVPPFTPLGEDRVKYGWVGEDGDYGYPVEVSSSLYRTGDLLPVLEQLPFRNPNTLEAGLAANAALFQSTRPRLACYRQSVTFCNPLNMVQNECRTNRAGTDPDCSAEALAVRFDRSERLDVEAYHGFVPDGCHQEVALKTQGRSPARPVPEVLRETPAGGDGAPAISVVVTCYNYGRYLKEAVGSVLTQTFRDFEVVIVDDGSTDNTPDVVREIVAANPQLPIRAIRQSNSGQPAHTRNRGIREARGRYVLCLDADDMIAPAMLERCIGVLESNPGVAIAYTDRLDFDGVNQVVKAAPYDAARLPYENHISYCALFRRNVWEDVGGYRSNVRGCEDWDFWVAAAARGHFGFYIPEPLFLYRRHDTGLYQHALANFDQKRAQIMLNNPPVYRAEDLAWAKGVLGAAATPEAGGKPGGGVNPLVTVIVPTANRPEFLQDALASLVAQDYPEWEAIVVNDGGANVDALCAAADPRSRIRTVNLRARSGPAAARNLALRMARGDTICYLDDDDIHLPNHFSTVVQALAQGGADFVYTESEVAVESVTAGVRKVIGRSAPYRQPGYSRDLLLVSNYIPINTWAHRWSCVEKAGFFDETLPALEDWELLLRFARHTTLRHVPVLTSEVRHRDDRGDSRSGHARKAMTPTYREIYARTADLESDWIRGEREKVLKALEQADRAAPTAAVAPIQVPGRAERGGYREWTVKHSLREVDAELHARRMLTQWRERPVFHLLVRDISGSAEALSATLEALGRQLYRQWRLTVVSAAPRPHSFPVDRSELDWRTATSAEDRDREIEHAIAEVSADWIALLGAGDAVDPDWLLTVGDYMNLHPEWRLMYFDEDTLGRDGERRDPRFKPDFNLDLLRSQPYIGWACLVRRDALIAAGGFGPEGAETYDMVLRVLDVWGEAAIGHVARLLCHRAEANETVLDETMQVPLHRRALVQHLARKKIEATVVEGALAGTFRVQYRYSSAPRVSILIATRDRVNVLGTTIDSVFGKTAYPEFDVTLADLGSEAEDTFDYYAYLERTYPGRIAVVRCPGVDIAAALNTVAAGAQGEFLLFMAADAVPLQAVWLERVLNHARRPDVAITGVRLVRRDQRVHHGGVILGMGSNGVAGHLHAGLALTDPGYLGRAQVDQNLSAVSDACLMIRAEAFRELGGFDAASFPVFLGGLDLCLRAGQRGQRIVWTPLATLMSEGTLPLPPTVGAEERARRFEQERGTLVARWLPALARDRAYNPNLSLESPVPRAEEQIDASWDTNFHDCPRVLVVPLDTMGVGHHRAIAPMRALEHAARAQIAFTPCSDMQASPRMPTVAELERLAPDTLYLQSTLHDAHLERLGQYRRFNRVFKVFDFEDLKTDVPEKNSRKGILFPEIKRRLREALASCDRMTVTTQPLADAYRHLVADIRVLPLRLARSTWGGLVSKRRQGPRPRVGWAGAQQHQADLEVLIPVVKATAEEVDWVFFGMCLDELKPYVREIHGFVPFDQYPQKLASLNLDLAVAPLELHPFNEAKTNLRLLEFGIMGWPVVCTDILPYADAPVQRVPNESGAWLEAIRARVHDLDSAAAEGDRLRTWVDTHYMLEDHLDEWLDAMLPSGSGAGFEAMAERRSGRGSGG